MKTAALFLACLLVMVAPSVVMLYGWYGMVPVTVVCALLLLIEKMTG